MSPITTPPYPSKDELKATRAPAIVAFLIMFVAAVTLAVMAVLQIIGAAEFHFATYVSIVFGGILAILLTALIGTRRPKGRARNITGHPPTRSHQIMSTKHEDRVQAVVDRINKEGL